MVELVGGRKNLEKAMFAAKRSGEYQWALQLVDHLLNLESADPDLRLVKADLLDKMSKQDLNVTARTYDRSYAQELRETAAGE